MGTGSRSKVRCRWCQQLMQLLSRLLSTRSVQPLELKRFWAAAQRKAPRQEPLEHTRWAWRPTQGGVSGAGMIGPPPPFPSSSFPSSSFIHPSIHISIHQSTRLLGVCPPDARVRGCSDQGPYCVSERLTVYYVDPMRGFTTRTVTRAIHPNTHHRRSTLLCSPATPTPHPIGSN